jgi:hypothetical protein
MASFVFKFLLMGTSGYKARMTSTMNLLVEPSINWISLIVAIPVISFESPTTDWRIRVNYSIKGFIIWFTDGSMFENNERAFFWEMLFAVAIPFVKLSPSTRSNHLTQV